ncbi:MAG: hypothetical protein ACRYG4_00215 [Janthinobacterium lividum]
MTRSIPPHLRRLLFYVTLAGTVVAAILPPAEAPTLGGSDKLNHMTAFVVLTCLAAWAWPRLSPLLILVAMALVGGAIELLQAIPFIGRDAEWDDWGADVGATAAALLVIVTVRTVIRRDRRL